jgi:tetratricopeptide (TPR) repeat protein
MLKKFMRKQEIEELLEGKGDYVKINYLENFLKLMPPIEMRKFAYLKLAEIYLDKKMFSTAAQMFRNAAINSVTFREKKENYLREAKLYLLAGNLDLSEKALKRALDEGNSKEKKETYSEFIDFFIQEAKRLNDQKKYGQAERFYEKLIRMKISEEQKKEIEKILLDLYEKLGKREEYNFLKQSKI